MSSTRDQAHAPVVIAVFDPLVHPEAIHIAAATARQVVEVSTAEELARHHHSAFAIVVDEEGAQFLLERPQPRREKVFLIAADQTPVNFELAMKIHAEQAYALPAEAAGLLTDLGRAVRTEEGLVVGVTGCTGGCGVSTFAAALGVQLSELAPTTVVGTDPSGGMDLLLGVEDEPGPRWDELDFSQGSLGAADVREVLPTAAASCVSSSRDRFDAAPLTTETILGALRSLREEGYTVVDLPRADALDPDIVAYLDHLVVIVPREVRAVCAISAQLSELRRSHVPLSFVTVARTWASLSAAEVETVAGITISAEFRFTTAVAKQLEQGGLRGRCPRVLGRAVADICTDLEQAHPMGQQW
ncbi:hypothetical protein CCICO_10970 [Corynebacterium ciconiae DSM 44920]|uniref:septum site-determining protein Ssd n=1 Tax=Corynebacterium ciconiae TaxID=227319 RepID=UPI0003757E5A|nr:septum site-determining protein Ssd [Corynebacterium ciconiae]WKD62189.1 hypothetical protein CCICO_10970 [Corynebacterium ciconiae DSM 44920]